MELDESFDADADEIEKGDFVSYKYLSETPAEGIPLDPKISFFSLLCVFNFYSLVYIVIYFF
jgi:hypothetical protein